MIILPSSKSWRVLFKNVTLSPGPDMISMETVYFACGEGMGSSRTVFLEPMHNENVIDVHQHQTVTFGSAQHRWVGLVFDHFQAAVSKKLHQFNSRWTFITFSIVISHTGRYNKYKRQNKANDKTSKNAQLETVQTPFPLDISTNLLIFLFVIAGFIVTQLNSEFKHICHNCQWHLIPPMF